MINLLEPEILHLADIYNISASCTYNKDSCVFNLIGDSKNIEKFKDRVSKLDSYKKINSYNIANDLYSMLQTQYIQSQQSKYIID